MNRKLYLYGVVNATEDKSFGPIGMSTDGPPNEILLKTFEGLGVVFTDKDLGDEDEIPATRKNLINHQKVIEAVMVDHTILPFSFGTAVDTEQQIVDVINERRDEFVSTIEKIDGKVELSLKIMWEKMDAVFANILEENIQVRAKKDYLAANNIQDQNEKIELGRLVEEALVEKKEDMIDIVIDKLQPLALDMKVQKNITEAMFANVAFFVSKSEEAQFDQAVNELSEHELLKDNTIFKYVGPIAPFNFI
ncbi:MAG: GvpL/GvpF family gas vesicle protein [Cyclobacteriaceae bacterium]